MKRIRHLIAVVLLATATTTAPIAASAAITPSIVPSRISGVAPLAVFFDATGTTAVGATNPFHTLEYSWNFGDMVATWDLTTGASKNLATGPVAAHVFDGAGTYTVTLSVTNGVETATTTTTITVSDPNVVFSGANTICVSATALPVKGVGGCPAGAAVVQSGNFATIVNTYAQPGKRVLLKRGDIFGGLAKALLNKAGPGIIAAYGTGAKPVIRITDSTLYSKVFKIGVSDDWRLVDLDIDGQSALNLSLIEANGIYTLSRLLLLRIDAHDLGGGLVLDKGSTTVPDQIFLVDSTIKRIRSVTGGGANPEGSYWFGRRIGVLGNVIDDTTGGYQLVRINYADRAVYSPNLLQNSFSRVEMFAVRAPDSDPTLARGCTACGTGDAAATKFVVVSRNQIKQNSTFGVKVDTGGTYEVTTGRIRDVLIEANWITTSGTGPCIRVRAIQVTVRNNICDLSQTAGSIAMQVDGNSPAPQNALGSSNVWVYNNTVYSGGSQANLILTSLQFPPVSNLVLRNNLLYGVKATTSYIVTGAAGSTVIQGTNGTTNPMFAHLPVTQPGDLALTSGSYAIGAGAALPVFTNFFGQPRQIGSALDMGAIIPR